MHNVTVESMGNHMFVRFKSDGSIRGKGFKATFSSQEGGCGGRMTAPSGKKWRGMSVATPTNFLLFDSLGIKIFEPLHGF